MKPYNGQNVIITGVSSGIGKETARCLAKHGYRVFGSVRKIADAQALQSELGERFQAMVFDVCDGDDIKTAATQVSKTIGEEPVTAIINNIHIYMHRMQCTKQLAFVFMHAFDLNVKQHVRIHTHTYPVFDQLGKRLLVHTFDSCPMLLKCSIVRHWQQLRQIFGVGHPLITYDLRNQFIEAWVAM